MAARACFSNCSTNRATPSPPRSPIPIHAEAIAAIRKIDPQRIILVSPGNWGDIRELDKLRLPDDDDRIIVTVHCYEPFHFTHQGAGWVQLQQLRGIVYPGPPATPLRRSGRLQGKRRHPQSSSRATTRSPPR